MRGSPEEPPRIFERPNPQAFVVLVFFAVAFLGALVVFAFFVAFFLAAISFPLLVRTHLSGNSIYSIDHDSRLPSKERRTPASWPIMALRASSVVWSLVIRMSFLVLALVA